MPPGCEQYVAETGYHRQRTIDHHVQSSPTSPANNAECRVDPVPPDDTAEIAVLE